MNRKLRHVHETGGMRVCVMLMLLHHMTCTSSCLKEVLMAFHAIVQHHELTHEQVRTITNK